MIIINKKKKKKKKKKTQEKRLTALLAGFFLKKVNLKVTSDDAQRPLARSPAHQEDVRSPTCADIAILNDGFLRNKKKKTSETEWETV